MYKLLLICYYDPNGLETIVSNIASFLKFSRFEIDILNFFGDTSQFKIRNEVNLNQYHGLLFHSTVTYNARCLDHLIKQPTFLSFSGVKVVFKQDEHINTKVTIQFLKQIKADVLCTLLEPEQWEKVYPKSELGDLRFFKTLTGYVTPSLREIKPIPFENRKLDISYRGCLVPIYFGRHSYDKTDITYKFRDHSASKMLISDVSSSWEDRIHGQAWIDFLCNSRATLGVESGASIFDLDGKVQEYYKKLLDGQNEELANDEWCEKMLDKLCFLEDRISYKAISPRHFEAAATRTMQVLYPGHYSGILEEGKHYLKLEKDFSNFEDLIPLIMDEKVHKRITDAAHQDIILNKEYWIETFVENFDNVIEKLLLEYQMGMNKRSRKWTHFLSRFGLTF